MIEPGCDHVCGRTFLFLGRGAGNLEGLVGVDSGANPMNGCP